jgi:hypothetical protein
VVELVDTPDLGSGDRKVVQVRVLSRAKKKRRRQSSLFFCPGRKPTAWLSSGLEVKNDVFSPRKNRLNRLSGRDDEVARQKGVLSKVTPVFSFFCPGRKPTAWLSLGLEVKNDVFSPRKIA